jgi:hypothetical protein
MEGNVEWLMWGKVNITKALKICCTKATRNGKYVLWGYQHFLTSDSYYRVRQIRF